MQLKLPQSGARHPEQRLVPHLQLRKLLLQCGQLLGARLQLVLKRRNPACRKSHGQLSVPTLQCHEPISVHYKRAHNALCLTHTAESTF